MATRLRTRTRTTDLHDLIEDNPRVVALEGFQPFMGQAIERGRYFRLSDPIVRAWPAYFAVVVPVADVLAVEIER